MPFQEFVDNTVRANHLTNNRSSQWNRGCQLPLVMLLSHYRRSQLRGLLILYAMIGGESITGNRTIIESGKDVSLNSSNLIIIDRITFLLLQTSPARTVNMNSLNKIICNLLQETSLWSLPATNL